MSIFLEEGKLIGMIIGEGVFDGCTELETMILPLITTFLQLFLMTFVAHSMLKFPGLAALK